MKGNWGKFCNGNSVGSGLLLACSLLATQVGAVRPPEEVWNATYDSGEEDEAYGIGVDRNGCVFVAGRSGAPPSYYVFRTVKYDGEGTFQWDHVALASSAPSEAYDVAVGSSGSAVYAVGSCHYLFGHYRDFFISRYIADADLWFRYYDSGGDDAALGAAADDAGCFYVTGYSGPLAEPFDCRTVKYSSNGEIAWNRLYDSGDDDWGDGVAVDREGNVVVAGASGVPGFYDQRILKYDSAGTLLWNRTYGLLSDDRATDVVVDSAGCIYTTGHAVLDWRTMKCDPEGRVLWDKRFDSGDDDFAYAIAIDGGGFIYVAGASGPSRAYDFRVAKYDREGNEAWHFTYDSGADDLAQGIAVDPAGYLYVTGFSGSGSRKNFRTIKYRQFLSVAGRVTGAVGVEVELSGALSKHDTTDDTGCYEFSDLPCGENYTVTPRNPAYTFVPPSRNYTPLAWDEPGQDFAASGAVSGQSAPSSPGFDLRVFPVPGRVVRIRYELAAPARVSLLVYDALGRKVATLVDGTRPAGNSDCHWKPNARGIYFLRLTSGSQSVTAKVVRVE